LASSQVRFDPTEKLDCPFCPCTEMHEGVFTLLDAQGRPAVKMCLVCFVNLSFDTDAALEEHYDTMRDLMERVIRRTLPLLGLIEAADLRASAEISLLAMGVMPSDPTRLTPQAQEFVANVTAHVAAEESQRAAEALQPRPEPENETPAQTAERLLEQLGLNWHKDG
jgi:hypothetical protein